MNKKKKYQKKLRRIGVKSTDNLTYQMPSNGFNRLDFNQMYMMELQQYEITNKLNPK